MKRLILMVVMIGVMSMAGAVQALNRDGATFTIDCTGFISNGGGFTLDRDNTGTGREHFVITAFDGAGNVIYGPVGETFAIGSRVSFNEGRRFNWTARPTANPIVVRVTSPAGNGYVAQAVYAVNADCPTLSAAVPPVLEHPAVQAPVGNPEAISQQPGSVVINTYRLNVRSGDGLQYAVIGQLSGGQQAAVLGINQNGSWWYVQAGELRGWIANHDEFVVFRGDLSQTPVLQSLGTIQPPTLYVYANSRLHVGQGEGYHVVCDVAGGAEYVINHISTSGEWINIRATCNGVEAVGWIYGEYGAIRNSGGLDIPISD